MSGVTVACQHPGPACRHCAAEGTNGGNKKDRRWFPPSEAAMYCREFAKGLVTHARKRPGCPVEVRLLSPRDLLGGRID